MARCEVRVWGEGSFYSMSGGRGECMTQEERGGVMVHGGGGKEEVYHEGERKDDRLYDL